MIIFTLSNLKSRKGIFHRTHIKNIQMIVFVKKNVFIAICFIEIKYWYIYAFKKTLLPRLFSFSYRHTYRCTLNKMQAIQQFDASTTKASVFPLMQICGGIQLKLIQN